MKKFIKNRDWKKICVLIEKSENQKWLVFLMHWLWWSKDEKFIRTLSKVFQNNNFTVVSFDTRNTFWESEWSYENATVTNCLEDLEDVIFWSENQDFYEEKLYLAGHSLGWICTTLFTQKYPEKVKALSPASTVVSWKLSLETFSEDEIKNWKEKWYREKISKSVSWRIKKNSWWEIVDRCKYDLKEKAKTMNLPILFIVWDKDETTPLKHLKLLIEKITCNYDLEIIKGAEHSFTKENELSEIYKIYDKWIKNINN